MYILLLQLFLTVCTTVGMLHAMDFSSVPESKTRELYTSHGIITFQTISPETATRQAPVPINPMTFYNNPILDPTTPYHIAQLAQMASVRSTHPQTSRSSENATRSDQLM